MRLIGATTDLAAAQRFAAALVRDGIDVEVHAEEDVTRVWAHDENRIDEAREAFVAFEADPDAERFSVSDEQLRRVRIVRPAPPQPAPPPRPPASRPGRRRPRRHITQIHDPWNVQDIFRATFTLVLVGLTIGASVQAGFSLRSPLGNRLAFCDQEVRETKASPLTNIHAGEVWRLLTPILLHLDFSHLFGNMLILLRFGSHIEIKQGPLTLIGLVVSIGVISSAVQALGPDLPQLDALSGSPNFGGMSGVGYGLFGYLWVRTIMAPYSPYHVEPLVVMFLVAWFLWCIVAPDMKVANLAHLSGLLSGAAAGGLFGVAAFYRGFED